MNRGHTTRRATMYKAIVGLATISLAAAACSSSKSSGTKTTTQTKVATS